jgi:hypothetical protein
MESISRELQSYSKKKRQVMLTNYQEKVDSFKARISRLREDFAVRKTPLTYVIDLTSIALAFCGSWRGIA